MMDRVRESLDRHYDAVFTASWLESRRAEDTSEVTIMLEDMVMETLDWDMVMVEDIMSRKS